MFDLDASNQKAESFISETYGFKNIIGTDLSIQTCIDEGYLMADTKGHKLMLLDFEYPLFAFLPGYLIDDITKRKLSDGEKLIVNTQYSIEQLTKKYIENYREINSFCGGLFSMAAHDNADFNTFINMADVLNAYCGLNF